MNKNTRQTEFPSRMVGCEEDLRIVLNTYFDNCYTTQELNEMEEQYLNLVASTEELVIILEDMNKTYDLCKEELEVVKLENLELKKRLAEQPPLELDEKPRLKKLGELKKPLKKLK